MARKELKPGTALCAPEILQRGVGVSSVNGGPGENELEPEGICSRRRCVSPPAAFCLLCRHRQRRSPRRAKPSEWKETRLKKRRAATWGRPYDGNGPPSSPRLFRSSAPASKNAPLGKKLLLQGRVVVLLIKLPLTGDTNCWSGTGARR